MEKLVYMLWRPEASTREGASARLDDAVPSLVADPHTVAVTVHSLDASTGDAFPPPCRDDGEFLGAVSVWMASLDDRAHVEEALTGTGCAVDGYLVTESVPRDYSDRDWPDGQVSPGVTMLTWFDKPARIDDATFYARWHGSHTPLALEVHPLTRYVRNAVVRPVTEGAPPLRGIVDEHVATLNDLTDPGRFFSGAANVARVLEDAASFLDLEETRSAVVRETMLRSRGPLG